MGLDFDIKPFNVPTGTVGTTIDITFAFTPSIVLFFWIGRTESDGSDNIGRGNVNLGWGVAVSTTARAAHAMGNTDSANPTQSNFNIRSDCCVCALDQAGTPAIEGSLDLNGNFSSSTIQLIVDEQFTNAYRVFAVALGGSDITNAGAGQSSVPTGTGSTSPSVWGFLASCAFMSGGGNSSIPATTAPSTWGFGAMAKPAGSAFAFDVLLQSEDAVATANTGSYLRGGDSANNQVFGVISNTLGSILNETRFTDFHSTGPTFNRLEDPGSFGTFIYGAIGGANVHIGELTTLNTTGDITTLASGMGFTPKGAIIISHCLAEGAAGVGAGPQTGARISIGLAKSDGTQKCLAAYLQDGTTGADNTVAIYEANNDTVYANIDDSSALQGRMRVKSGGWGSSGITFEQTDADPSAAAVGVITFGQIESATPLSANGIFLIPRRVSA